MMIFLSFTENNSLEKIREKIFIDCFSNSEHRLCTNEDLTTLLKSAIKHYILDAEHANQGQLEGWSRIQPAYHEIITLLVNNGAEINQVFLIPPLTPITVIGKALNSEPHFTGELVKLLLSLGAILRPAEITQIEQSLAWQKMFLQFCQKRKREREIAINAAQRELLNTLFDAIINSYLASSATLSNDKANEYAETITHLLEDGADANHTIDGHDGPLESLLQIAPIPITVRLIKILLHHGALLPQDLKSSTMYDAIGKAHYGPQWKNEDIYKEFYLEAIEELGKLVTLCLDMLHTRLKGSLDFERNGQKGNLSNILPPELTKAYLITPLLKRNKIENIKILNANFNFEDKPITDEQSDLPTP